MERNSPRPLASTCIPRVRALLGNQTKKAVRVGCTRGGEAERACPHPPASLGAAQSPSSGPARTRLVGDAAGKAAVLTLPSAQPPVLKREPVTRLPHSWPRRRDDVTEAKKDQGGKESPEQGLETQARHPGGSR